MALRTRIRELLKLIEESDVDEIEVSRWGTRIRVARRAAGHAAGSAPHPGGGGMPHIMAPPKRVSEPVPGEEPGETGGLFEMRSPMVGTFYRASAPDADPFVREGDTVVPGQVLCVIEAMKVMNQIESEVSGRIAKVFADNGTSVEYNQPLFLIKPE